jgi:two-component sensor histidine kinase
MFPNVPKAIYLKVLQMAGINTDDRMCYLPMISDEVVIGVLVVWGPELTQKDIPGLSVFANQVATAIRNTRLYQQAQNEILERIQVENQIRKTLYEKEILLKEVHHRVKNNLQVISSLLNLQAGQNTNPVTVEALRESQTRVRSMALIHEKLYQSTDLSRIDFDSYLHNLVNSLAQTYRINSEKVKIRVESEQIVLNIDTAIPCGLIVNELVSNSLKYAFPEDIAGLIYISCQKIPDHRYRLIVADNGAGLADGFELSTSPSLGLKLVTSLVKQIDGTLLLKGRKGTKFEILFSEVG